MPGLLGNVGDGLLLPAVALDKTVPGRQTAEPAAGFLSLQYTMKWRKLQLFLSLDAKNIFAYLTKIWRARLIIW